MKKYVSPAIYEDGLERPSYGTICNSSLPSNWIENGEAIDGEDLGWDE